MRQVPDRSAVRERNPFVSNGKANPVDLMQPLARKKPLLRVSFPPARPARVGVPPLGIAQGVGDDKFNPLGTITRQDMMVLTSRILAQVKGLEIAEDADELLEGFLDKEEVAGYAAGSVATMVRDSLIQGSDGRLNPRGFTTRAEAAVFLYRIYNQK